MSQGLSAAASGMAAAQTRLDALSNDLVNANTTGYRPERVAFHDLLYGRATSGAAAPVSVGAGVGVTHLGRAVGSGPTQQTGRALDVAIPGDGFLRVQRADGKVALTRDGSLDVDTAGRLVTTSGAILDPPVRLPRGTTADQVTIGSDGTVRAAGRVAGRLQLFAVTSPGSLQPIGGGDYVATTASGAARQLASARFDTGALEGSGVDMAQTMVDMTLAQRGYEMASRAVRAEDELMQIANQVKR